MRGLLATPVVIVAAALASGCSEDTRPQSADPAPRKSDSPPAEKAPTTGAAGTRSGREKASDGEKARDGHKVSGDGKEQAAATKRSTRRQRPTPEQIRVARENQGEQQVDDLPPRLKRIRETAAARQGTPQKQRQMSPEERRAFEIGTSSEYQNEHWR
jgi:hypothetical protein